MNVRPTLLPLCAALALALSAPARAADVPAKQPPLTALTLSSGGPMPVEQTRVHFDHADLHFTLDIPHKRLSGDAQLTFTATAPTDAVVLDLDRNLPISQITVDGKPMPASTWSNPEGRLRIALPHALAKGDEVTVGVRYAGAPHVAKNAPWDGGFVWAKTPSGQPWVATAVEGEGCDLFWPCIDQPTGKPDLVDTWVTVPKDLAAPGNGVLVGIEDHGATRTWHWRIKRPDTYAITINVGPFKELKGNYASRYGNTIPMEFWYLPEHEAQAKELFAGFTPMLDFFEQEIGPYPFGDEKMGVVETPHKGMEHQTINAYGNGYVKDGYGFDWLLQHEFAHEWFGNQVTNVNWDDMWLHEGFATYMQPLYSQYLHGDMDYFAMLHKERLGVENAFPIVSGKPQTESAVYDEGHGPANDIYYKGSLVLHTLHGLIGDDAFFTSIRELVYGRPDPKPGNFQPRYATTRDYIDIVDKVTGKDYGWFFKVYLYDAKLPKLVEERHGDTLSFRWQTEHGEPFPMPLDVQLGRTVQTLPMTDGRGEVRAAPGTLVIVDPHSKVLREMPHVEAFQQWLEQQKQARAKAGAKS
ncbi:MAG: peptidase M1 [Lysobacterales bacterium 14-68-21]|jgi:aminopeptidase N|nr:MAG: peptidase M1 [Xanthomonadales bacterium 15-68-25]OZB65982.1 MAG: peptidase M1 [Xanthomonadales bacterium 14-68-21]